MCYICGAIGEIKEIIKKNLKERATQKKNSDQIKDVRTVNKKMNARVTVIDSRIKFSEKKKHSQPASETTVGEIIKNRVKETHMIN